MVHSAFFSVGLREHSNGNQCGEIVDASSKRDRWADGFILFGILDQF